MLRLSFVLSMLFTGLGTGCRVVQTAVDIPGQTVRAVSGGGKEKPPADPVAVQQMLLRFAEQYATRMVSGVEKLQRGTNAADPAEILKWKVALATETCSIASGPNAVANLLDMTIFVTVMRMALEEHWRPKVFGDSALPLLESFRNAEKEVWGLAGAILSPEQQAELHGAIEAWRTQNPNLENVLTARAPGISSHVAEAVKEKAAAPGSVFSLLKVDPLAGMDPAVRELTQTRLFAERALYVTQQMPTLLRWQTELLSLNALEMPAVRQLVTNTTQIASSVERFASVAEKLPGQLSTERAEILKSLEAQEKQLTPLVNEVRQTLSTGAQMSTSLNTTLTTFDALMKRFGVGETNLAGPRPTNAEPFRIQDYTAAAAQLEATARQLTELLVLLDRTIDSTNLTRLSAQVAPLAQQAQTSGREIVDYAFARAVLLVLAVLLGALIYRFLLARLMPAPNSRLKAP